MNWKEFKEKYGNYYIEWDWLRKYLSYKEIKYQYEDRYEDEEPTRQKCPYWGEGVNDIRIQAVLGFWNKNHTYFEPMVLIGGPKEQVNYKDPFTYLYEKHKDVSWIFPKEYRNKYIEVYGDPAYKVIDSWDLKEQSY